MVADKLKYILPELKDIIDEECEPVKEVNVVAAIKLRIATLATLEDLHRRDSAIKKEYTDRFLVNIPHTETLPDDVLFCIKLKDADKTVRSRSYDCPQKYCAAWKILLDQHIAAGRLRPSSSAHVSPAFMYYSKSGPNCFTSLGK